MKDTMNSFLKIYYDNGLNYSSRIFFTETATDEQKREIINKYEGDFGGSVSVQVEGKTVSLDIYDITRDKVRFVNDNDEKFTLGDDGAYICMRIAEKFGLKKAIRFRLVRSERTTFIISLWLDCSEAFPKTSL